MLFFFFFPVSLAELHSLLLEELWSFHAYVEIQFFQIELYSTSFLPQPDSSYAIQYFYGIW